MSNLNTKIIIDINNKSFDLEIYQIDEGIITGFKFDNRIFRDMDKIKEAMEDFIDLSKSNYFDLHEEKHQNETVIDADLNIKNKNNLYTTDTRIRDKQGRKQCSKCKQWLSETEFYPGSQTRDKLKTECKNCFNDYKIKHREQKQKEKLEKLKERGLIIKKTEHIKPERMPRGTTERKCIKCLTIKPLCDFNRNNNTCKSCTSKYYAEWTRKRKEENAKKSEIKKIEEKLEEKVVPEIKKTEVKPILLPGEKEIKKPIDKKAPDNTSLFLNWREEKKCSNFDIRDFINQHPEITMDHAKTIIAHQIQKHKLMQLSSVDFKVL